MINLVHRHVPQPPEMPETDIKISMRWAYETRVPVDRPMIYQAGVTVWQLTSGGVVIDSAQGCLTYHAPCLLVLGSGKRSHRFFKDSTLFSIGCLARNRQGALFQLPLVTEIPAALGLGAAIKRARQSYQAWRESDGGRLSEILFHAAVTEWGAKLAKTLCAVLEDPFAPRVSHPGMLRALEWLENGPTDHRVNESEAAHMAGMSVSQFKRRMKQELGQTFHERMEQMREEACLSALLNGSKSIKEIAIELGFRVPSNFIRWFRKNHRQTPAEFRRDHLLR